MRSLMPFQRTSKAWLKNCVIESPTTSSMNVLGDNLVEVPMSAFGSRSTRSHPSAFGQNCQFAFGRFVPNIAAQPTVAASRKR